MENISNNSFEETEHPKSEWKQVGLEMLMEMIHSGEMDPWDIDLVYVIDKFLRQLQDNDLQKAAEVIFFVSVLLRIKSEKIYIQPEENEYDEYVIDDGLEIDDGDNMQDTLSPTQSLLRQATVLDNAVIRNTKTIRKPKERALTLGDLVKAIEESSAVPVTRKRKSVEPVILDNEDDIALRDDEELETLEIAHEEELENKIQRLNQYMSSLMEINQPVNIKELVRIMDGNCVDTFLSALFLSHSGKTEIVQNNIYQDLWLKRTI